MTAVDEALARALAEHEAMLIRDWADRQAACEEGRCGCGRRGVVWSQLMAAPLRPRRWI